jgi:hypothetical protein
MLATFGLERLEAGLEKDTVTATDVAEFLEQAKPIDVRTLAREGMPEALDCLHRRMARATGDTPYLPSRDEPTTDPCWWLQSARRPISPAYPGNRISIRERIGNLRRVSMPIVCSVGTSSPWFTF